MAQEYNIPDAYKGDTFEDLQFTLLENNVAIDLTGATIKCQFRKEKKTGSLIKTLTDTSGITVTDATGGIFKIDAFTMTWNAGEYFYDIQITDSSGVIFTYLQGTLNVIQDVTE